jgi:nitrogen fixation-related uncharacterized protein
MSQESLLVIFGGAVVTSLAGCVAFLFALFQKGYDDLKKRSEECEADREQLWRELASIKLKIGELS